jgi:hypothetical protein
VPWSWGKVALRGEVRHQPAANDEAASLDTHRARRRSVAEKDTRIDRRNSDQYEGRANGANKSTSHQATNRATIAAYR